MIILLGFLLCVSILLIIIKLYIKLTTGWCKSQVCLVGKTAIVTGGNTGIGYETAADLAKRGARVILACRNKERANKAVDKIINETNNKDVCYKILDLSSLKSVRQFADEIISSELRLDILINNAGVHYVLENNLSEDNLQQTMQANYFGHFLLTNLLLDLLKKSGQSRIINVSSMAAKYTTPLDLNDLNSSAPNYMKVYSRSKLCNILFTIQLNRQLQSTGVTTYSVHPGMIFSEFTRNLTGVIKILMETSLKIFFKNTIEGAQSTIHCAVAKGIEQYSGHHFHDCHYVNRYKNANDLDLQEALWKRTEELLKFKSN